MEKMKNVMIIIILMVMAVVVPVLKNRVGPVMILSLQLALISVVTELLINKIEQMN